MQEVILRWLVGLKLIQLEEQKIQLPFIILAKNLKPMLFFQIRVQNLKSDPPGFQFLAYFMTFLMSSDLRTNHSAVFLVRGGPPGCA